jgi:hypothetical protein
MRRFHDRVDILAAAPRRVADQLGAGRIFNVEML